MMIPIRVADLIAKLKEKEKEERANHTKKYEKYLKDKEVYDRERGLDFSSVKVRLIEKVKSVKTFSELTSSGYAYSTWGVTVTVPEIRSKNTIQTVPANCHTADNIAAQIRRLGLVSDDVIKIKDTDDYLKFI